MKIKPVISDGIGYVVVQKEKKDKETRTPSCFFYHFANACNKKYRTNIVRRRVWKDGHAVDMDDFYAISPDQRYGFYDIQTAWRNIAKEFDKGNPVELDVCGKIPVLIAGRMKR